MQWLPKPKIVGSNPIRCIRLFRWKEQPVFDFMGFYSAVLCNRVECIGLPVKKIGTVGEDFLCRNMGLVDFVDHFR